MNITDPVFLVISCRETNDSDLECDLIIDDKHILVEAIERVGLDGLDEAEQTLKFNYPNNTLITTHLPVLNLIQLAVRKQDLQAQLASLGEENIDMSPSDNRISRAFHWKDQKTKAS